MSMNISELESEILQLSNVTDTESNKKETSKLFDECDGDYEDIGESQLMELCSGSFATQHLDKVRRIISIWFPFLCDKSI